MSYSQVAIMYRIKSAAPQADFFMFVQALHEQ
jgi:hypothetical protein